MDEYASLLSGLGDKELREKISHLEFGKADKNHDNRLSYPELIGRIILIYYICI